MNGILLDLRFAVRTLSRSPWFTLAAALTLALGIGLNTALFSLVDAVLLRSLPYRDADRLVEIWGRDESRTGLRVPGPLLEALKQRSRTLQSIAIHGPVGAVLRTDEGPIDVRGDRVSANFTDVMGVAPLLGRGFRPDEEAAGAPPAMLVSYSFWQRHMRGDTAAIGRALYFDSVAYTVVGVMPPSFRTSFRGNFTLDYWTPHVNQRTREFEREEGYELVARLAPKVTIADALRELTAIQSTVTLDEWRERGRRIGLVPLKNEIVGDSARALKLVFAAVAVVLTIVCANLALLLLARSDRRVSEFATRKAIGAGEAQLFRLALVESLLIALAGGLAGVVLAYTMLPALLALAPEQIPRITEARIDWRALSVALGLTVLTGCAFGFVPALRLSRLSLVQALKRAPGRVSSRSAWFRSVLVTGQVSASIALCVVAGLVGRTFLTLVPTDPGFDPKPLKLFVVSLSELRFPDPAHRLQLMSEVVNRASILPGVSDAGLASGIPFEDDFPLTLVRDAQQAVTDSTGVEAQLRSVSPNYHHLLQIPLRRGRLFDPSDTRNSTSVAIVNETLARRLAPNGDALGRTVRVGRSATARQYQIVGIVADVRFNASTTEITGEIVVPHQQRATSYGVLIVRSDLQTGQLTPMLRSVLRSVAPAEPLFEAQVVRPMDSLVRDAFAGPRFTATLSTLFSVTALLLAAMGVFGLVAYSVSQRRAEFGIRAALGARPQDLAVTSMRTALMLTTLGVTLGLATAIYFTRFIESQLYGVKPLDPPTFIGAAALMLLVAVLAALIPARRAVRTSPMLALRSD